LTTRLPLPKPLLLMSSSNLSEDCCHGKAKETAREAIMRRVACSLVITMVLLPAVLAQQPQTFGAGVSLNESTPLDRVLDRPADYEGKTIRVEGVVTAVCMHMGCWMALAPASNASNGRTVLVKVDDGVIVFPVSAKGRRAVAQGVVERIGTGDAEGQEAAGEHAKQTGTTGVTSARLSWQLKATGAVVY
jgi:hypothetical protein